MVVTIYSMCTCSTVALFSEIKLMLWYQVFTKLDYIKVSNSGRCWVKPIAFHNKA